VALGLNGEWKVHVTILASYWFLLGLLFNPEDGGDMFLCNIGPLPMNTQHYVPEDISWLCMVGQLLQIRIALQY
jgi:hypothetical protein